MKYYCTLFRYGYFLVIDNEMSATLFDIEQLVVRQAARAGNARIAFIHYGVPGTYQFKVSFGNMTEFIIGIGGNIH